MRVHGKSIRGSVVCRMKDRGANGWPFTTSSRHHETRFPTLGPPFHPEGLYGNLRQMADRLAILRCEGPDALRKLRQLDEAIISMDLRSLKHHSSCGDAPRMWTDSFKTSSVGSMIAGWEI